MTHRSVLWAFACCLLIPPAAWAQATQGIDAFYYQWEPPVLRAGATQTVRLEVKLVGKPTQIEIELDPTGSGIGGGKKLPLRDDGAGGDRIAGDNIWTVMLDPSQITPGLQADDVFSRFVGFVQSVPPYILPCGLPWRLNIFAPVVTEDVARMVVRRLGSDVQHTAYVANIVDPAFLKDDPAQLDYADVAKKFYRSFSDDYDFLNIVIYSRVYFANRGHLAVRNDVQGIGANVYNNASTFGSSGRLRGITVFPNFSFFDGAETAYQHELGHQWINYLNASPLDRYKPHWPLSSLASGIMGFSIPPTNEGGEFACFVLSEAGGVRLVPRTDAAVFTDLDLYLMGLAPAEEVQEHIILAEQDSATVLSQCRNQLYSGAVTRMRLADIVKVAGPRVPAYGNAPRRFKVATLVVSPSLLSEDALALVSLFASRAEETAPVATHSGFAKVSSKPFAVSTRGRGTLDASLLIDPASVPQITARGVVNAASYLPGAVAGGEIVTFFGSVIGSETPALLRLNAAGRVATTLGDTRIFFDGVPAPLIYVSANQSSAVVPYAVVGKKTTQLRVEYKGVRSSTVDLDVAPAAPGMFTANMTGEGQALMLNEDGSLNSSSNPADKGRIVVFYATGEGQTKPAGVDGKPGPGQEPFPRPLLPVSVRIGGVEAQVLYAGGAPGYLAGFLQVNVRVPPDSPSGSAVSVTLTVGDRTSQPRVTMAIR
jgi:uncharacterized protein (TIGR03437 family)